MVNFSEVNEQEDGAYGGVPANSDEDVGTFSVTHLNNEKSLLGKIYEEKLMTDIILAVGIDQYTAHRAILSARSDVFYEIFTNMEWSERKALELFEEPCCLKVFPQFLKFMYVGEIQICVSTVMPILILADKYNIKDLFECCLNYITENIEKAGAEGHLISWLQCRLLHKPNHQNIIDKMKKFLKWNLELISKSRDFVELDMNVIVLLLQQNDLVVSSEYELLNILQHWLLHRKALLDGDVSLTEDKKNLYFVQTIEQTLVHIRFPMMSTKELAKLILSPLLKYHKDFIVDCMTKGMNYHDGKVERQTSEALQFTPRLYTNNTFSTSIEVEYFHTQENYRNFGTDFTSKRKIAETDNDQYIKWNIEFFPKGVQLYHPFLPSGKKPSEKILLKTVRLKASCTHPEIKEESFKIAVLINGVQKNINHIMTVHQRIEYFSEHVNAVNMDNLIRFEELQNSGITQIPSPYLTGVQRDKLTIKVIILPMAAHTSRNAPPFEFNFNGSQTNFNVNDIYSPS